ncbi:MAG TPA: radical SAM protein [Terriglobales bacterium]|jgi:uncharacterized protein|nr:radical SAM protein [Terriglobales bacterium]
MTVELRPLGVRCNIQCQYCYQEPQRGAGNVDHSYDLEKMKQAVKAEGGPFSLFGGEPLLVPERDLEDLWSWGYREFGKNSVQTNGVLINTEHIRMFKQYNVHVGISIDGPGALNDVRWHGTLERTRESTARTELAIEWLCREGIPPSMIVTLHRNNATADKLATLLGWVRELDLLSVRSMRLHLLEAENQVIRAKYALSTEENIAALFAFRRVQADLRSIRIDLFSEMRRILLGDDENTTCVWNGCDPYTTRAVRGIEGQGQRSNCGRTNKDGIDFVKSDRPGFERYLALYATPQRDGGCKGCRFFLMCKGQCPGTAIDGDWRNRTEHCEVWKALYTEIERDLTDNGFVPLSVSPRRETIEREMLKAWAKGTQKTLSQLVDRPSVGKRWRIELRQLRQRLSSRTTRCSAGQ